MKRLLRLALLPVGFVLGLWLAVPARAEEPLKPLVMALEKFDAAALAAASPADLGQPAAHLLTVLDTMPDKKLADAFCAASLTFLHEAGGAKGYFDFMMAVSTDRLKAASRHSREKLSQAQKDLIRALATKVNQPSLVVDTGAWAPAGRNRRGPMKTTTLDLSRVRRAVAAGTVGAVFDLASAYDQATGGPEDVMLAHLWRETFDRLLPGLPRDQAAARSALAAAGSAYYLGELAVDEYEKNQERLTDALWDKLQRAAQGGFTVADEVLADCEAAITARRSGKTFAQFYGIGEAVATSAVVAPTAAPTAVPTGQKDAAGVPPNMGNYRWPVPAGAKPSAQPPAAAVRLVYDPAVEREAKSLAARLGQAGLKLTVQARPLPRTAQLYPVLALPAARGGDLGVFLWHTVPEQMAAVHAEPGVPADELRLHAPAESTALAQGEVWILAHPSRVAEAQAIEAKLKPYSGASTLIETSVSWRGLTGPEAASQSVLAPDPENVGLQAILRETGLAELGPVQALRLPERPNLSPDLVIVLRGAAGDEPRGLTADDLALLGRDDNAVLLFAGGNRRKSEHPQIWATRALWGSATGGTAAPKVVAATDGWNPEEARKKAAALTAEVFTASSNGTMPGGVEKLSIGHYGSGFVPGLVGYHEGYYTLTGENVVYFSRDARQWETSHLDIPNLLPNRGYRIDRVLHDGRRWAAIVFNSEPEVLLSTDRKHWTSGGDWKLNGRSVAARDGMFWSAGSVLDIGVYLRGRFDAKPDETIKEWDGQVQDLLESDPRVVMQAGNRLFLVADDGRLLSTDNGHYWEQLGDFATKGVGQAYYAEGHDAAVAALVTGSLSAERAQVWVQRGDVGWKTVATPFENVQGLAYGFGRFVAIGTKGYMPASYALYESADGETWTRIAELPGTSGNLAKGPAGFLVPLSQGQLILYRPPGVADKPARVRPPTPVPDIRFRDFTPRSVRENGDRKYGADRSLTQEERRVRELQALVPKAHAGDAAAKRELALILLERRYAYGNPWRTELWFKEAMAAGDPQAGRGYAQLLMSWKPETPAAQIEALLRDSAGRGDEAAKTWLAHRDTYAKHIAQAEAGDIEATMRVAPLLLQGAGVTQDIRKGVRLLWSAGDKKHAPALMLLAEHYEKENATGMMAKDRTLNRTNYLAFLTAAGDAGHAPALHKLVTAYSTGVHGVDKDDRLAYASALKLANLGDAEGMAFVGGALLQGRGVAQDAVAAGNWIRQAAAKGHAQSKIWVEQQAGVVARSADRPPKDGRVAGVTAEVWTALQQIQATAVPELGDADLRALFNAVWFDAEYSLVEEDLAQELVGGARPVVVTAADGRKLDFTKTLPAKGSAGFAHVLPVGFNAADLRYYFTLWQQTANAGLLVAATRLGEPQKAAVRQALAKNLFDMAVASKPKDAVALADYFKQVKLSYAAASPAVRQEFRDIIAQAVDVGNQAAKQAGRDSLLRYLNPTLQ